MSTEVAPRLRLAELIAALSLATDLGTGQPMEHALRTCLLSVRLARQVGVAEDEVADVYYLALLRFVGCTANSHDIAVLTGGDDIAFFGSFAAVFMGDPREALAYLVRHLAEDQPLPHRLRLVTGALADPKWAERSIAALCEVGVRLAGRLGLGEPVEQALAKSFERWDGKGLPGKLAGEAIPLAARIVVVAGDAELVSRIGGLDRACDILARRRGKAYDPAVVDAFLLEGDRLLAEVKELPAWDAVLAAEPQPLAWVSDTHLDEALGAFADFTDLKSPFTRGHSPAVAKLGKAAARAAGAGDAEAAAVRRAGLVHDLGRTGIPNGVWDKPGSLSREEWERVRLHPYFTERILSQSPALVPIATLAGSHHERVDGSGYHRGAAGAQLTLPARVLAAADAYQAMTQQRPHRPAMSTVAAARELTAQAKAGRLDGRATTAVLEAAGQPAPRRAAWPRGLTDREVEVLRLIARGRSNTQAASTLGISAKTVGHHVEHIHTKIGVATRPGAALFAMEHGLLDG